MKARVKAIIIAAVFPLFLGAIIGMSIEYSDAQMLKPTNPNVKRLAPKSFGSYNSLVCGDQLCAPQASYRWVGPDKTPTMDVTSSDRVQYIDRHTETTPTVKLASIQQLKQSTNKADSVVYLITYTVTAGTERLENIHVHVRSDLQEDTYFISSLDALKTSVNTIRVMALDADSIDGGVVSYSVAPPTHDPRDPKPELRAQGLQ